MSILSKYKTFTAHHTATVRKLHMSKIAGNWISRNFCILFICQKSAENYKIDIKIAGNYYPVLFGILCTCKKVREISKNNWEIWISGIFGLLMICLKVREISINGRFEFPALLWYFENAEDYKKMREIQLTQSYVSPFLIFFVLLPKHSKAIILVNYRQTDSSLLGNLILHTLFRTSLTHPTWSTRPLGCLDYSIHT